MLIREIMTSDPFTISPETPAGEAAEALRQNDFRHLPVVEDGVLTGMISDRDVGALITPTIDDDFDLDEMRTRFNAPVSALMTGDVVSVHGEMQIGEGIDQLLDNGVGALPVVDPSSGRLEGILSYVDVLRALRGTLAD